MLDQLPLPHIDHFSKYAGPGRSAAEISGASIARIRKPLRYRRALARDIRDGQVTVANLTISQIAAMLRVPVAGLRVRRPANPKKSPVDVLSDAWDRTTPAGRERFLRARLTAVWEAVDLITR